MMFLFLAVALCGCSESAPSDDKPTPAPRATVDTGYRGEDTKPDWLRFQRGARGYLTDAGHPIDHEHDLYGDVKVCPTPELWVSESDSGCVQRKVGQIVKVRKTGLMAMLSEAEPIQVYTASWRGVVGQNDVVPIIPKGTRIECSGADGVTGLIVGGDPAPIGLSGKVVFEVTHTERPQAVGLVDVVVVEGDGTDKRGQLEFAQLDCKIDGFLPLFDSRDVEELSSK